MYGSGGGYLPSEVREFVPRWGMLVSAFSGAVNPMSGAIQHLPCDGAYLDQPCKTMEVWRLLQGIWIECMPKGDGITERIRGG